MNLRSGRLRATVSVEEMQRTVCELGFDLKVIGTSSPQELQSEIRRLVEMGIPRLAVAGGDGTVKYAVQELAFKATELGIVPQGTMNNFATALRLPQDLPSALRAIAEAPAIKVDLGRCAGRFFVESAGVGLFANVLALYGNRNKNPFAALYAIIRLLADFRARRLQLEMSGTRIEERCVMCLAANTFRMGQAFPIAPGAKLTDGLLDVIVLGDLRRSEIVPYFLAVRRQTHLSLPKVRSFRVDRVSLQSRRRMLVHVDDKVPTTTPVTIEAVPGALNVVVDRP